MSSAPDDSARRAREETRPLAGGRDIAPRPAGVYGAVKRLADVVLGVALLALLAPLLLLVALLIRLDSPGPALFRQRRIGRGSREFTILKFRTMQVGTPDLASHLMGPGSSRVTKLIAPCSAPSALARNTPKSSRPRPR